MSKIRSIVFNNHPVLKNLTLDFCDNTGKAVDTVIIAGENGCGKSTLLNCLYAIASGKIDFECSIVLEQGGRLLNINFKRNSKGQVWAGQITANCVGLFSGPPTLSEYRTIFEMSGIFSDVDINFRGQNISSVTSLALDSIKESRRSSTDLPMQIKQLLIDIQAQDDADVSRACIENPSTPFNELYVERRMPRFTRAFDKMFEGLSYSRINTTGGQKNVIFIKKSDEIKIDDLSSGEKQVVYRGCFLLKDINAMNGAFVFIDEPEISLHPSWQIKIMDYYKGIFTNSDGVQTSQIFAVTHSPFIIHNENRKNDKVIILARDEEGKIIVKDKPEYYKCDSMEVVQDAFSIRNFSADKSVVYLEGRTDEKYFKKAAETFGYSNLPFEFRWVGYMKNEKDEENTGKDALNKAVAFLIGRNLPTKNVCLFDCDTARQETVKNNVFTRVIPTYENSKRMKKGIENALVLDSLDLAPYYTTKIKEGDYGDDNTIVTLEKMELCNAICSMGTDQLKVIMKNLKAVIDSLLGIFQS